MLGIVLDAGNSAMKKVDPVSTLELFHLGRGVVRERERETHTKQVAA